MTRPWITDGRLHFAVGVEDTFVPQAVEGERPIDEYELTEHYARVEDDLGLAKDVGCDLVRWGVPWYRIQPEPDRWDWSWLDRAMARFGELGLSPIVDLMHYGTPLWLDGQFDHPDYPRLVAEYAAKVAERYPDVARDFTPVNEPMIHSLFCGEYGYWPPYLSGGTGLTRMATQLADGFRRTQNAIVDVAREEVSFVHVDAGMRYVGDVDAPEHAEHVRRLTEQVWLVEDLVTGRVDATHPLARFLLDNGADEALLADLVAHPVAPDVMGVNYYPLHSTEVFEAGVHHGGGFADPRPTRDDGTDGLAELLREAQRRYGAPVMISETCVTGSVDARSRWMAESLDLAADLRAEGMDLVGYTWWPLFDMYEWTYRHATGPRADHLLTMGLWSLEEAPSGLERVATPLVEQFARHAAEPRFGA
ncbi:family 1 glycosylhydrolase [Demequina salsinemoris]|uniref:family 1 glycosylhydrolase n=1 Tax=Demequina salsinemoris TaxID=577470 RepID=UPI000785C7EE|nr:family 1 glycosylhydrolase [Demequina salsinemoris]